MSAFTKAMMIASSRTEFPITSGWMLDNYPDGTAIGSSLLGLPAPNGSTSVGPTPVHGSPYQNAFIDTTADKIYFGYSDPHPSPRMSSHRFTVGRRIKCTGTCVVTQTRLYSNMYAQIVIGGSVANVSKAIYGYSHAYNETTGVTVQLPMVSYYLKGTQFGSISVTKDLISPIGSTQIGVDGDIVQLVSRPNHQIGNVTYFYFTTVQVYKADWNITNGYPIDTV